MDDLIGLLIRTGFVVLLIVISFVIFLNRGRGDRFWTSVTKDIVTAQDQVYQMGSVRIYRFMDGNTVCYVGYSRK